MDVKDYRKYVKYFFSRHLTSHRRYKFVVEDGLHFMDSQFIIQEINDSSDDEIEVFYDVFRQMDTSGEVIHRYLEYMSGIYIKTNKDKLD